MILKSNISTVVDNILNGAKYDNITIECSDEEIMSYLEAFNATDLDIKAKFKVYDEIESELDGRNFSDAVIEYLIDNDIALVLLCHQLLKNEYLLRIYQKDNNMIEALQTVAVNMIRDDTPFDVYKKFIIDYPNAFIYVYIWNTTARKDKVSELGILKCEFLCNKVLEQYHKESKIYFSVERYRRYFSELKHNPSLKPDFDLTRELNEAYGLRFEEKI